MRELDRIAELTLGECAGACGRGLRSFAHGMWPLGALLAVGLALSPGLPCSLEGGVTSLRLSSLAQGVQLSALRTGDLPGSMAALQAAMGVDAWPTDAWGRPVHVLSTPDAVALVSLGADGELGGTGADADLSELVPRPASAALPLPASPAQPPG
jgi:hypothetical protein